VAKKKAKKKRAIVRTVVVEGGRRVKAPSYLRDSLWFDSGNFFPPQDVIFWSGEASDPCNVDAPASSQWPWAFRVPCSAGAEAWSELLDQAGEYRTCCVVLAEEFFMNIAFEGYHRKSMTLDDDLHHSWLPAYPSQWLFGRKGLAAKARSILRRLTSEETRELVVGEQVVFPCPPLEGCSLRSLEHTLAWLAENGSAPASGPPWGNRLYPLAGLAVIRPSVLIAKNPGYSVAPCAVDIPADIMQEARHLQTAHAWAAAKRMWQALSGVPDFRGLAAPDSAIYQSRLPNGLSETYDPRQAGPAHWVVQDLCRSMPARLASETFPRPSDSSTDDPTADLTKAQRKTWEKIKTASTTLPGGNYPDVWAKEAGLKPRTFRRFKREHPALFRCFGTRDARETIIRLSPDIPQ